jgi:hypothetical protein
MEQLWNDMRTTVYETMGIEQTAVPVNPEEDEADSKVQSLSQELDVDALNEDFKKFAGMDDMLSRVEYDTFIKTRKIPPAIAGVLWSLLDTDGSGEVSKDEFKSALIALQSSRSWSRYCPACEYRNDCAFCQECNSGCPRCSDVSFCASCWNDHPGRQLTMEEQALHPLRLLHPLHPLLPLHICICIYIYIYILHLHLTSTSYIYIYARRTHCTQHTQHTHRTRATHRIRATRATRAIPYPAAPEQDNQDREPHPFGSTEYMRETVLIRPLEWAYNSRALRGAPEAPHHAANNPADSRARRTLLIGHGRFACAIQSRDATDARRPEAEGRRRCQGGSCRRRSRRLSAAPATTCTSSFHLPNG